MATVIQPFTVMWQDATDTSVDFVNKSLNLSGGKRKPKKAGTKKKAAPKKVMSVADRKKNMKKGSTISVKGVRYYKSKVAPYRVRKVGS